MYSKPVWHLLYLIDPTEALEGSRPKKIAAWMKEKDDTKPTKHRAVRLIGGTKWARLDTFRRAVLAEIPGRESDVTLVPESQAFYHTVGNIYHAAYVSQKAPLDTFDPVSKKGAPDSLLSKRTNVFLKSATGDELVFVAPTASGDLECKVTCSETEAAGQIRTLFFEEFPQAGRVLLPADMAHFAKALAFAIVFRHQWVLNGGVGQRERYPDGVQDPAKPDGKTFEGYLLNCLKRARLP